MAASPLTLGSDLTHLDANDLAMLGNDEVIAVNQAEIAAKQVIAAQWSALGLPASAKVRDLWTQMDLGSFTGSYQATLASHACALLRISL